jgi:hypothetical protein
MRTTRRSAWVREAVALRYLARAVGDVRRARQEYLEAAQAGNVDVRARPTLMAHVRELTPREEWFRAEWLELPDRLATGFHFLPVGRDPPGSIERCGVISSKRWQKRFCQRPRQREDGLPTPSVARAPGQQTACDVREKP